MNIPEGVSIASPGGLACAKAESAGLGKRYVPTQRLRTLLQQAGAWQIQNGKRTSRRPWTISSFVFASPILARLTILQIVARLPGDSITR